MKVRIRLMAQQTGIKIWWDTTVDAYRVVTPYRPQFVDLLKQLIPSSDRGWDGTSKTWTITEKFLPAVKDLAERIFGIRSADARAGKERSRSPRRFNAIPAVCVR